MTRIEEFGRLSLRVEGDFWNAYLADKGSMQDAVLLGSIRLKLVENNARKQEFMRLMKGCFSDQVEEIVGQRPIWKKPQAAPENERTRG